MVQPVPNDVKEFTPDRRHHSRLPCCSVSWSDGAIRDGSVWIKATIVMISLGLYSGVEIYPLDTTTLS